MAGICDCRIDGEARQYLSISPPVLLVEIESFLNLYASGLNPLLPMHNVAA